MAKLFSLNKFTKTILSNGFEQKSHSICTSSYKFQIAESKVIQPKEVRINVPWGHVAGKWYGSDSVRPILMLHGWQDNAGTFNTLIPQLPRNLSYLSIDLPGHGFSSRIPDGMFYSVMSFINVLNIIQNHYKWDKLSFCSHSMGAQLSSLYASLYPEQCDLLICFDALLKPHQGTMEKRIEYIGQIGREFLLLDKLNRSEKEPPTYTYDEIVERWAKQTRMTIDGVKHLAQRGITQSKIDSNRYYFSRDIRLKIMEFGSINIPDNIQFKLMERIAAPYLFIKANKTEEFEGFERYEKPLEILKTHNKQFEWIKVIGSHHVHLTHPEVVSDKVSSFISKHRLPTN